MPLPRLRDKDTNMEKLYYFVATNEGNSFRVKSGTVAIIEDTEEYYVFRESENATRLLRKENMDTVVLRANETYAFSETKAEALAIMERWFIAMMEKYESGLIALENTKTFDDFK